jgi:hypothetical protein
LNEPSPCAFGFWALATLAARYINDVEVVAAVAGQDTNLSAVPNAWGELAGQGVHGGEARIVAQHAEAVANFREKVLKGKPLPNLTAVLLMQSYIPSISCSGLIPNPQDS